MIFQHTVDKVLDGTKTQTRRPVKPGERPIGIPDYNTGEVNSYILIFGNKRASYRVLDVRAVQPGRGKRAVGRIRITGLRREDVRTISDDDVKAEGFSSRDEFLKTWISMHSKNTYRVVQEMLDVLNPQLSDNAVTDYCNLQPADRYDAWVIEFELVKEAQS